MISAAVMAVLGILVCGWGAVMLGRAVLESRRGASWPTAPGRIVSSEVVTGSAERRNRRPHAAAVIYRYELAGRSYDGYRVTFGDYTSTDAKHAQAVCRRYPRGKTVEVRYDPKDPRRSVLELGMPWLALVLCFSCLAIAACAAFALLVSFGPRSWFFN